MTAPTAVPFVWIAPEPADAAEKRAMAAWATERQVELQPADDRRPPALAVNLAASETIEGLLDRARDALSSQDTDASDRALRDATDVLVSNPGLPNAAWLRAEVDRLRSTWIHASLPADTAAADRAWMEGESLDGGRISGVGERAAPDHPRRAELDLGAANPPGVRLWVDGRATSAGQGSIAAGTHDLLMTWDGTPVWAQWVDVASGGPPFVLPAEAFALAPVCSDSDLRRARMRDGVIDPAAVRCERWALGTRGLLAGSVRVATCLRGHCEPLVDWSARPPWLEGAPEAAGAKRSWPSWATWALAGGGAAVAAGIVAAIVAANEPTPPAQAHLTLGPLKSP